MRHGVRPCVSQWPLRSWRRQRTRPCTSQQALMTYVWEQGLSSHSEQGRVGWVRCTQRFQCEKAKKVWWVLGCFVTRVTEWFELTYVISSFFLACASLHKLVANPHETWCESVQIT